VNPVSWWAVAIALITVGVIGTFVPVLPGAAILFGGMLLGAWIDHFQRVGWITLSILAALMVLIFVVDFVAALLGAKRVGASRLAIVGAFLGTIAGLFFGIAGVLIAPFIGAVIGELLASAQLGRAALVGFGTWIGMTIGALVKMALVFAMLAVFVTKYVMH